MRDRSLKPVPNVGGMTVPRRILCYRGVQIESDGGLAHEERVMEDQGMDDGVDISITDEVQSDLDMIARSTSEDGSVEQDTL